jgi:hypothetical protein
VSLIPFGSYRTGPPGDNGPSRPEIVASEQRVLIAADALCSWMREVPWPPEDATKVNGFMMHTIERNPAMPPRNELALDYGEPVVCVLDKMDRDANRFFFDLMRAAWELRCWRRHYGEIPKVEY